MDASRHKTCGLRGASLLQAFQQFVKKGTCLPTKRSCDDIVIGSPKKHWCIRINTRIQIRPESILRRGCYPLCGSPCNLTAIIHNTAIPAVILKCYWVLSRQIAVADFPEYRFLFPFTHGTIQEVLQGRKKKRAMDFICFKSMVPVDTK